MRPRAVALGAVSALALTTFVTPPATATAPGVINGTPLPPLAGAAVLLESDTGYCTGSLVLPNLVLTAAHCFVDDGVQTSGAADWQVYPPGVNATTTAPASVRPTQLLLNSSFRNVADDPGIDVAYLVLDGALATPAASRIATGDEVRQLVAQRAVLDQVGYGQTVPRSVPDAPMSDVPVGMSAPIDELKGQGSYLLMRTNGTTGTCSGDSGSPWLASIAGQVVLVGILSSGDNAPCESGDVGVHDYVALPSAQPELLNQAITAAGSAPLTPPRTCIKVKGSKQECTTTRTWTYRFCWAGSKYSLQQRTDGAWTTITQGKAKRSRDCNRKYPYLVDITTEVPPGTYDYRFVMPKQRGVTMTQYDPFTVTSS